MKIGEALSSARRHGLNEWDYLVDVLYRLSDLQTLGSMADLLPDRWQKSPMPPTEVAALPTTRQQSGNGLTRAQNYYHAGLILQMSRSDESVENKFFTPKHRQF